LTKTYVVEFRAHKAQLASKEPKVKTEHRVSKGLLVLKVRMGCKAHKEETEPKVLKESKDDMELPVCKEYKVKMAFKVHKDYKDRWVHKEFKEDKV
jgi:hypothetical protein